MSKVHGREDIKPLIPNESYDEHYPEMQIKDSVILDLGSDYGSTAYYFLNKGAKRIFGVETNPIYVSQARKNNLADFYPIIMDIDHKHKIEVLLFTIKPNVVKCDIEGAEVHLLDCDPKCLVIPIEWYIETHSMKLHADIKDKFVSIGYRIVRDFLYVPEIDVYVTQFRRD